MMTDEMNCKLIDLVQSQSCIYDKTDVFYSNKDHVKTIWQDIANQMQLPVPVCQKRWRYLRDYFVRQLHMTQTDDKRSYWILYERMKFLKPFSTTRKIRSSTSSLNNDLNSKNIKIKRINKKKRNRRQSKSKHKSNTDSINNNNNAVKCNSLKSSTGILSISSNSGNGNSCDEFNSLDYLNLYNAQFGIHDDIINGTTNDDAAVHRLQEDENHIENLHNNHSINILHNNEIIHTNEPQILIEEIIPNTLINNNLPILMEKSIRNSTDEWPINHKYDTNSSSLDDDHNIQYRNYVNDDNDDSDDNESLTMKRHTQHQHQHKYNELLSIFQTNHNHNHNNDLIVDEHDYFFKSLLTNVHKINNNLIMSFRSEILQTIIKYQYMSENHNNNNETSNNNNNNYDGETSEIIIIDTGELDWRKKLKNRF